MEDDNVAAEPAADEPQTIPNAEPEPEAPEAEKPEAEEPAKPEPTAEEGPEEEPEGEEEEQEDDPPPKRKRPGKYQRTVSKLEDKIERLEGLLMQRAPQQPQQPAVEPLKPPRQEDFTDYGEYLTKVAEWNGEQAARKLIAEERQTFQQGQQQRNQQAAAVQYSERAAAAKAKFDDFDEVIKDGRESVPVNDPTAKAIMSADNGPEIEYHLYTHPEEAKRIAGMDPISQVRAIGRLEAKLLTPSPKKTTSAPKPVKPLGGTATGGVGSNDPAKMSVDEIGEMLKKAGVI